MLLVLLVLLVALLSAQLSSFPNSTSKAVTEARDGRRMLDTSHDRPAKYQDRRKMPHDQVRTLTLSLNQMYSMKNLSIGVIAGFGCL
jgi:hypothetical protein